MANEEEMADKKEKAYYCDQIDGDLLFNLHRKSPNITFRWLAKHTGVSVHVINRLEYENNKKGKNPEFASILQLCDRMSLSPLDFVKPELRARLLKNYYYKMEQAGIITNEQAVKILAYCGIQAEAPSKEITVSLDGSVTPVPSFQPSDFG
jgi:hypothetical protein